MYVQKRNNTIASAAIIRLFAISVPAYIEVLGQIRDDNVPHALGSARSMICKRWRRIERQGTNGSIATAHVHRPFW